MVIIGSESCVLLWKNFHPVFSPELYDLVILDDFWAWAALTRSIKNIPLFVFLKLVVIISAREQNEWLNQKQQVTKSPEEDDIVCMFDC